MQDELELALEQLGQGEHRLAEARMRRLLAHTPELAPAMQVLAMALASQGQLAEARELFVQAAALQPASVGAWLNVGNVCLEVGDHAAAEAAFARAHALGADDVAWLLGHGLSLLGLAQFAEANRVLHAALTREPEAADVRLAYAQSLAEMERFEELAQCLRGVNAVSLDPAQRRAFAWLLAQAGDDLAAQEVYRQILLEAPDAVESRVQFSLLLERLNRVDEADNVLKGASAISATANSGMYVLAAARILRRQQKWDAAITLLASGLQRKLEPAMQAQLGFELARNHERLGQVDLTMQALSAAHTAAEAAFRQRSSGEQAPGVLDWLQQRLQRSAPASWQQGHADALPEDPVFLVGFPRSGTTLLERMLDAHSQLDVLDERPALEVVIEQLRAADGWPGDDLDTGLDALSSTSIDALRRRYWAEVQHHLQPQGRLVDKYPLTMTRLPYVARLFPKADWILLIRHPCDCVLSCYMQAFGSNGGALAFASLESTARTYVAIMEWWHAQRALIPARVHTLRYEDLVGDVSGELGRLMDFLSLPVEQQQFSFDNLAATRSRRINTPSYSQVVQPLNAGAVGRWRPYRAHFSDEVLAALAPWVHRYGYTLD